MRNLITIVLALGLVGCVDGEEAPVATVTAPAPPPARALVARQMPTLPSLPSLPEPATSDPWAPTNVYENGEGGAEALYDEEGHEIDLDEERAIARANTVDEHDYEGEGAGKHDYGECAEGCGEEYGDEHDYVRDEANDPINLPVPEGGPACEDCD